MPDRCPARYRRPVQVAALRDAQGPDPSAVHYAVRSESDRSGRAYGRLWTSAREAAAYGRTLRAAASGGLATDACPGTMRPGGPRTHPVALVSTWVAGVPDFPGMTAASVGQTMVMGGPGRLVAVAKCDVCGHSQGLADLSLTDLLAALTPAERAALRDGTAWGEAEASAHLATRSNV